MQKSNRVLIYPILSIFVFFWIPRVAFIYINKAPIFDHLHILDFLKSVAFDLSAFMYLAIPFSIALTLCLVPKTQRYFKGVTIGISFLTVFFVFFACFAEIFFIDEFNSRFNFIAVDYLIYTNEVLKNVMESYPVGWIILGILVFLLPLFYFVFIPTINLLVKDKIKVFALLTIVAISSTVSFYFIDEGKFLSGNSAFFEEISKNSISTFFHAYSNNEINYFKFYKSVEPQKAISFVHEDLENIDGYLKEDQKDEDELSIVRNIIATGPAKKTNVILVLMESMSSKFLGHYGSTKNLTPNLDILIDQGAWFSQVYATGTRTVRGIEALLIGIPPTPGQSIVRRELGGKIFQLGSVFAKNDYYLNFIYGGHSYFDNMKSFFSDHSYQIFDEGTFPSEEIDFANAWGVSDEDLFNQVLKIADQQKRKPFFSVVLTTSNHRPYTYPDQKVDIPSKTGRDGAIKYSDYAIGEFIKKAKTQPWFDDTLFVFVADHNASVSGGETLDYNDYLVPVIFYSPKNIQPSKLTGISSQIDIAPTILSFLNISYQSRFWGTSLWRKRPERAFISTYQKIGFIEVEKQVTLSPKMEIEVKDLSDNKHRQIFKGSDDALEIPIALRAISYYTAASYLYGHSLLQEDSPATSKNIRK